MGFHLLDIILVLILVLYFLNGLRRGFFVSLGTLAGFALGVLAAFYLTPWVITQVDANWYVIAAVISVVLCVVVGQWLGFLVGRAIRRFSDATPLRGVERVAGAILNLVVASLAIVVLALIVKPLGVTPINTAVSESKVIEMLVRLTPDSWETQVEKARAQVMSSGVIPEVQNLLFPSEEAPTEVISNPALEAARESVVQIWGAAEACSFSSEGSGFVAAPHVVVTNAHVVSGVEQPVVQDAAGKSHRANIVYYNPTEDLALLRVDNLETTPLTLGSNTAAGTTVAFMGFPQGGPFQNRSATVQGLGYTQTIDSATGEKNPVRLVYQLAANVEQGNSGGPVLDVNGNVVGVIFAKATQGQTGYAIPVSILSDVLASHSADTQTVDSGQCTPGTIPTT